MIVWFVYATKSQRALSRDNVARQSPTESRDKIAGVTSLLYNNSWKLDVLRRYWSNLLSAGKEDCLMVT